MNTDQLKEKILEEAGRNGVTLSEDELNAKLLESSRMDPEKLECLNGGLFNCNVANLCWSDFFCFAFSKSDDDL